ncbi:hypothetical protein GGS23DRAFT_562075 [Durotheca rogersii]|uniref:uncharacterized protein n=1 Tax=Durotheca rogersii TaxID=419775 RepID=UPI00221E9A32|nr:uncharacterized protein GGS23DRAFT_562075 [Durotheca rogersii]KAI5864838.1 hypothetical protein GGS23DRAFT_562075 [Durotheca rogersii]
MRGKTRLTLLVVSRCVGIFIPPLVLILILRFLLSRLPDLVYHIIGWHPPSCLEGRGTRKGYWWYGHVQVLGQ